MTTVAATITQLQRLADGQGLVTRSEAGALRDAILHLEPLLPTEPLPADQVAQQTGPLPFRCGDCGHRWDGPWLPAPMGHTARLTHRFACCPRCGSSRAFMGGTEG